MKTKAYIIKGIAAVFLFFFTDTAVGHIISFHSLPYILGRSPLPGTLSSWIAEEVALLLLAIVILLVFFQNQDRQALYFIFRIKSFVLVRGHAAKPQSAAACLDECFVNRSVCAIRHETKSAQQKPKFLLQ